LYVFSPLSFVYANSGTGFENAQPTLRSRVAQSACPIVTTLRHAPLNRLDSFTQRAGAPSLPTYDGVDATCLASHLQHTYDSPLPTHRSRNARSSYSTHCPAHHRLPPQRAPPAPRSLKEQAAAMFRAQSNIFDDVVVKATDENLTSENWEYILVRLFRYCAFGRWRAPGACPRSHHLPSPPNVAPSYQTKIC
jgi:hypothetical protein